jgi:ABC-type glycerol-3-phosphate transport system substrate-binding protein
VADRVVGRVDDGRQEDGVSGSSNQKEAGWALVRELTFEGMEEYFAKRGRAAHARKSKAPLALQIPDIPKNAKLWLDANEHGKMGQPISAMAPQINDIVAREMELLFIGKKSVKDTVDTIKKEAQPLADKNKE